MERSNMELYTQLDALKREIRLAVLVPGPKPAPIECKLIMIDLAFTTEYFHEALSYMWGRPSMQKEIILNNHPILVRENLWLALHHFRSPTEERVIWIDAICINHGDISERNHQVGMMREIYSCATMVHVWLGAESRRSREAFTFLRRIKNNGGFIEFHLDADSVQYGREAEWEVFSEMCNFEYWTRVWVVQEIILAERITIHCGEDSIDWDTFSAVRHQFANASEYQYPMGIPKSIVDLTQSLAGKIDVQREARRTQPETCRLIQLLEACEDSVSHDPRDRIYGLLGVASDVSEQDFPIDYQISLSKLHASVFDFYRRQHPEEKSRLVRFSQFVQRLFGGQCDLASQDAIRDAPFVAELSNPMPLQVPVFQLSRIIKIRTFKSYKIELPTGEIALRLDSKPYWRMPGGGGWVKSDVETGITLAKIFKGIKKLSMDTTEDPWERLARRTVPVNSDTAWAQCAVPAIGNNLQPLLGRATGEDGDEIAERIAFEFRNGYAWGVAAGNVRVGDEVCQFFGCDVTVVLRRIGLKYILLSTAVINPLWNGLSEMFEVVSFSDTSSATFQYGAYKSLWTKDKQLTLNLDIPTLQLISRW
jgi:hypothetical protein